MYYTMCDDPYKQSRYNNMLKSLLHQKGLVTQQPRIETATVSGTLRIDRLIVSTCNAVHIMKTVEGDKKMFLFFFVGTVLMSTLFIPTAVSYYLDQQNSLG